MERCGWKLTAIPLTARKDCTFPMVCIWKCKWGRRSGTIISFSKRSQGGNNENPAKIICVEQIFQKMCQGEISQPRQVKGKQEFAIGPVKNLQKASKKKKKRALSICQVQRTCRKFMTGLGKLELSCPPVSSSSTLFQPWRGQISRLTIGVRVVDAKGRKTGMKGYNPLPSSSLKSPPGDRVTLTLN